MTNSGRRVWILEDDSDLRSMLGFMLLGHGFEIVEIGSMREAWELFRRAEADPIQFAPHRVISDYCLPDGNSEEWMTALRNGFPEAAVVCLSASLDRDLVERLKALRIATADKPIRLSALLALVRTGI